MIISFEQMALDHKNDVGQVRMCRERVSLFRNSYCQGEHMFLNAFGRFTYDDEQFCEDYNDWRSYLIRRWP